MVDPSLYTPSKIAFIFTPEPRQAEVDLSQGNYTGIVIVAQNRSDRPVRVQPVLDPLWSQPAYEGDPLSPAIWASWISLPDTPPEVDINSPGAHRFIVRISPPPDAALGTYHFRLSLSGVEYPDEEFATSEPITFKVTGPRPDLRPFALGASALLLLVILGIIGFFLLVRPRPSLEITLIPPPSAVQGEPATYTLRVTNVGSQLAANLSVHYTLPDTIVAATAFVPGETLRHCDVLDLERRIRCQLGSLEKDEITRVEFLVIPGPASQTITNTLTFTVSAQLGDTTSILPVNPKASHQHTPVSPAPGPFAIALLPSTSTPLVQEDFDFQVLAWGTVTSTQTVTVTFTLPVGLRYTETGIEGCQTTPADYFTLRCRANLPYASSAEEVTRFSLPARAILPTTSPARLEAISDLALEPEKAIIREVGLDVVNSALYFDGVDDWVQLGYKQAPQNFTIEMWVQPYSSDDGQCFAGLHREEPDKVSNLFLVGYWFDSLHVNVNGISHNLDFPKDTHRYHLAVVVEKYGQGQSKVTVYKNGVEQAWLEPEPLKVCDRCKIFDSILPGGENSLAWVLGQEWDLGSQGKKASDFFHGTLGEVRIWDTARTKDEIQATYRVRPGGSEANLVAYYRLEPVVPNSQTLDSLAASATLGQRMGGITWVEAAPGFGTALHFNGFDQALAVPGLMLADFKPNASGEVEITLAGWIMVDQVPTQPEWILGSSVPSGSTQEASASLEGGLPAARTTQAALVTAQDELLTAQQAAQRLSLDTTQVISASHTARQGLFYSLYLLSQGQHIKGKSEAKEIEQADLWNPEATSPDLLSENVGYLQDADAASSNPVYQLKVGQLIDTLEADISSYQVLWSEYNLAKEQYKKLSPTALVVPVQAGQPLPATAAALVKKQELALLLFDEKVQFYSHVQELIALADQAAPSGSFIEKWKLLREEAQQTSAAGKELQDFPPYAVLHALARLERAEQSLTQYTTTTTGEARVNAFQDLQSAQQTLSQSAARLETWLQSELQTALQSSAGTTAADQARHQATIAGLATAQYYLQSYQVAQANLEAVLDSQERIASAQEQLTTAEVQVAEAQAHASAVAEAARLAQAEAAHCRELEEAALQARQDLAAASTDTQKQAAQRRLDAAQTALQTAILKQYQDLLASLEALQDHEDTLADLEPRLIAAVEQATQAAFSAARRYNVERWIGPTLDLQLGTTPYLPGVQEAIRPAALLAAQMVLKTPAEAEADQAEQELKDAQARQARLADAGDQAVLRQEIIDQIVAYLDTLSAPGTKPSDLGQSQIPLVLAEALAQTIADQVTAETIRRLLLTSTPQLLSTPAELEVLARAAVRANITEALEASRRPLRIRLYYQSAYAILRLDGDLASTALSEPERKLKTALRSRLAAANQDLLSLLNAQNVSLVPASGLEGLIEQVVDQSRSSDDMDRLVQDLQAGLDAAFASLQQFLGYAEAQQRTSGLNLPDDLDTGSLPPGQPVTDQISGTLQTNLQAANLWAGLLVDADGHVVLVVRLPGSSEWTWQKDEKPLQPGQWVHYAAVVRYDALTGAILEATLYRDGNDVKGDTTRPPDLTDLTALRCTDGFYIGGLCASAGSYYFAGRIDEIRLWNRALSEKEIDVWRKLPGIVFNEVAYWAFDDGPGHDSGKTCLLGQTCDLSRSGGFHLAVQGPGWVEADAGLASGAVERP